jgi:hypothetical protein
MAPDGSDSQLVAQVGGCISVGEIKRRLRKNSIRRPTRATVDWHYFTGI